MIYASTFLSYSHVDSDIVHLVARELGRRGVVPWLDKDELGPGVNMVEQLKGAIKDQAAVVLFLSKASVASDWVKEELEAALTIERESGGEKRIIPVFFGDAMKLVVSHPLLNSRWMHPDGNRVTRKGIMVDMNRERRDIARDIAVQLSRTVYRLLGMEKVRELVFFLDQRGEGRRHGKPEGVPPNIDGLDCPVLVFRPDEEERDPGETLCGRAWEEARDRLIETLSIAMETLRDTSIKLRLLGNSQLAFTYQVGKHCNRNTSVSLYCYNRNKIPFSNDGQQREIPLQGGNPHCESTGRDIAPMLPGEEHDAVALLLGTNKHIKDVQEHMAALPYRLPLVWVESAIFRTNEKVMEYIADVVALLGRLRTDHNTKTIYLYCGLPFHMVPILAANLLNIGINVIFMEYRRDLANKDKPPNMIYTPVLMK